MDDVISRQKALNVIKRMRAYIGHNMERAVGAAFIEILDDVGKDIGRLPSAQLATDTNVGTRDMIDRQQAIDAVKKLSLGETDATRLAMRIGDYLERLPSAQPEIVKCKNCKHWIPYDWMFSEMWQSKNRADYPEDEIGCNLCDMAMKSNDFCSRAERRTDG